MLLSLFLLPVNFFQGCVTLFLSHLEGFKELEANYFNIPQNVFRDTYIKDYGQEAWDKRLKLLVDGIVSRELHFEKTGLT